MHHLQIDRLACGDSPIHRLDARTKLIAAIAFTVFVISLGPMSVSILACYAIGPFAVLIIAGIPLKFVLKQILIISPFVLVLAASSLFYERSIVSTQFGPFQWHISAGLLRCLAICGKFVITMTCLIALIATTRFSDLLSAMSKLGVPKLLVTQLGFLNRYIFLLMEKAHHILRARSGRKLKNLGLRTELKTAAAMVGTLCLSGFDTASRVSMAMQGRGFNGRFQIFSKMKFGNRDGFFIAILSLYLFALYFLKRWW